MNSRITKAVFPVAGLGSRFLPATKATPKEMLPVVDKPLIQYAVEEAVEAGITDLVFVTGRTKRALEDHFDTAYELEVELEQAGKSALLEVARDVLPGGVSCVYTRQAAPLGLGHAVLCARPVIGDEPFAVLLPDDLIRSPGRGCLAQMVAACEGQGAGAIAVQNVARADTGKYGIVEVDDDAAQASRVHSIVEKPAPDVAPSTLGVVGRYVLPGRIMEVLESTPRGAGGEIQLTDAIAAILGQEPILAWRFDGTRYDCGSKVGYLQANVDYGLEHPETGAEFSAWLDAR